MLTPLIAIPLIGAALVAFLPGNINAKNARFISWLIAGITFLWTIVVAIQFNFQNPDLQFVEFLPWLDIITLNYNLGIDGLSLPLIILNSLLVWIAIYSSDLEEEGGKALIRPRLFYSLILLLGACVAGALLAQNLLLFFLFYEIKLVPMYLLIAIWGGEKRGYAATKYLLYTALSGVLVIAAFLGLVFLTDGSFDYNSVQTQILPLGKQILLLAALIVGFAVKIPLVPLHTWLPDAYTEASTPVSILLGGMLSKLGTYGLIRFGFVLFPDAWQVVAPWLAGAAVISGIYGSLVAIAQTDIKRMVAYSSIAHISFVILATAAGTPLSIQGAICQMFAHGLILALLFHLIGIIETKTGSRDLVVLKGLMNPLRGLPFVGGLTVLAVMASAGIPGMVGFIGEFLSFQGSFTTFPVATLLCLIATGLTAIYFVILLNKTFFGRLDETIGYLPKVHLSEKIPALVLMVLIVILGIQPNLLLKLSEATSTQLVKVVNEVAIAEVVQK